MLMTLEEAALKIRPDGLVSARSLRAEIAAGRLSCHRIAGRLLVSDDDIAAYLDRARVGGPAPARQKPAKTSVVARPATAATEQPKTLIPGPLAAAAAALTMRGRAAGKRAG